MMYFVFYFLSFLYYDGCELIEPAGPYITTNAELDSAVREGEASSCACSPRDCNGNRFGIQSPRL